MSDTALLPVKLWRKIIGYATDIDGSYEGKDYFPKAIGCHSGAANARAKLALSAVLRMFHDITAQAANIVDSWLTALLFGS